MKKPISCSIAVDRCLRRTNSCTIRGPSGERVRLRKHSSNTYTLRDVNDRVRWGTKAQICEDIAAFRRDGVLPRSKTAWH